MSETLIKITLVSNSFDTCNFCNNTGNRPVFEIRSNRALHHAGHRRHNSRNGEKICSTVTPMYEKID